MKILFTSPILEHPAVGGPQLRIENSIKALSRLGDLYIVSRNPKSAMGGDHAEVFYKSFCKDFFYAPSVSNLSPNRYIRKIQRFYKKTFADDSQYFLHLIEKLGIDVVWFGYGNISFDLIKKVKSARPNLKVICDTDSVWSRFLLRELPYEDDPKRRAKILQQGHAKEVEEAEWVNLCDITTAVSEIDAEYYRSLAQDKEKVMLFSNVIDLDTYKIPPAKPHDFKTPCIYLAGSFGPKSAMDKAARWFIHDIYPMVKKEIPDIHFYIVGNGSKETLADIQDESISILGRMPSVLPYLCHANVSLVPLQFESGTRFKIMEAAACRVPIVSTILGAEGIPVEHGKNIFLTDDPINFAMHIVQLIQDQQLARRMADDCYSLIAKHNSLDSLTTEAKEILQRLSV